MSRLFVAAAQLMAGDVDGATESFESGRAESVRINALAEAQCLAYLALIHMEADAWREALPMARAARTLLSGRRLEAQPSTAFVLAVSYLGETHAGRAALVTSDRHLARNNLSRYRGLAPFVNLETRMALAWADLLAGDRARGRTLVSEAERILPVVHDAVRAKQRIGELRSALVQPADGDGSGPSSLTAAELRVLRCLPTHLTLAEIAQQLFVSRNTVKSQAIAIYRKLGTASRGNAVAVARDAGLLDDTLPRS
jgi:LuxR family maltose regulon positive regulatory protein